jgi:hypothetical protein
MKINLRRFLFFDLLDKLCGSFLDALNQIDSPAAVIDLADL